MEITIPGTITQVYPLTEVKNGGYSQAIDVQTVEKDALGNFKTFTIDQFKKDRTKMVDLEAYHGHAVRATCYLNSRKGQDGRHWPSLRLKSIE